MPLHRTRTWVVVPAESAEWLAEKWVAMHYRDIAYHRGRILAGNAALDEMDRSTHPLLFRRGDS